MTLFVVRVNLITFAAMLEQLSCELVILVLGYCP